MTPDHSSPRVTVEQLIRLKRSERPAPEYWHQFEREMRVKQLAAIVEPRPWWAPFIRIGTQVARYQLPVGATAILALTFLTVGEYREPAALDAEFAPGVVTAKVDTMPGPAVAVVQPSTLSPDTGLSDTSSVNVAGAPAEQSSRTAIAATTDAKDVSRMVPMLAGGAQTGELYSPAARVIAANLAAVKASAPELVQMIERVSGMDALISPRSRAEVVDPLARVKAPSENRRSNRLLASALPVADYGFDDTGERNLNRVDRRLTEERLYDSISRFGLKADRVAIKF